MALSLLLVGCSESPQAVPPPPPPLGQLLACGDIWTGSIAAPGEVDYAHLLLGTGELATLTLRQLTGSEPGNINVRFIIARTSGGTSGNLQNQRKIVIVGQGTGTVRLEAQAALSGTGSYEVGLDCIFPPSPLNGNLGSGGVLSGTIDSPVESDQFTFDGQVGDVLMLTILGTDFFPVMTVYDPDRLLIATLQFGGSIDLTLPASGQYVVQVSDFHVQATGSYWLSRTQWLDRASAIPASPIDAVLTCNATVQGGLSGSGDVFQLSFQGDADPLDLTLTNGSATVQAALLAPNWPSGLLAFNLSQGTQQLLLRPSDGPYVIRVWAADNASSGSFALGLSC